MVATSALAQTGTNMAPPPPAGPAPVAAPAPIAPAPAENTAPAKPEKKKAVVHKKRKLAAPKAPVVETPVTLNPGPATVAVDHVNVRGQAGLKGEVVAHLTKGDTVNVLSQINLDKHKADEPAQWAKIALPSSSHSWVKASFIDASTKTVTTKKLNLRAGPGENYSVLGVIEHGATINEITSKNGWMQIETPTSAYAFVAAMFLKQEPTAPVVVATPPPVEPMPAPAPAPVAVAAPQPIAPPPAAPEPVGPPPPRVVQHEGVVRGVGSPVAPTPYELYDPITDRNINYLMSPSKDLDLSRYDNMRIIVTGEESLDNRWKDTPIITIDRIQVISTNAVKHVIFNSPRQGQRR